MLTAFLAGYLGSLFAIIWLFSTSPAEGEVSLRGVAYIGVMAFDGAIMATPIGLLILLLIGIPLTLLTARQILEYPVLSAFIATSVGILIGGLAGQVIISSGMMLMTAICGAVFGCLWIIIARRKVVALHTTHPD